MRYAQLRFGFLIVFLFLLTGCAGPVISPTASQEPLPISTDTHTPEASPTETSTEIPSKLMFDDFEYLDF